mmetsp:Transcript_9852/g.42931  ORF Transcript_9852/g.42931 Transcript_9852/m.42931 type:complete len:412 (-) Transcript_9852:2155-3390(-)
MWIRASSHMRRLRSSPTKKNCRPVVVLRLVRSARPFHKSAPALEPADDAGQRSVRRLADGLQVLVERLEPLEHRRQRVQPALGQHVHDIRPERGLTLHQKRGEQSRVRLGDQTVALAFVVRLRREHIRGHLPVHRVLLGGFDPLSCPVEFVFVAVAARVAGFTRPRGFIRHRPGAAAPNEDPREQLDQTEGTNRLPVVVSCLSAAAGPALDVPPPSLLQSARVRLEHAKRAANLRVDLARVDKHAHRRVEHVDARGGGLLRILPPGGESRLPEGFPARGRARPSRRGDASGTARAGSRDETLERGAPRNERRGRLQGTRRGPEDRAPARVLVRQVGEHVERVSQRAGRQPGVDAEAAPPSYQNAADGRAGVGGVAGARRRDRDGGKRREERVHDGPSQPIADAAAVGGDHV